MLQVEDSTVHMRVSLFVSHLSTFKYLLLPRHIVHLKRGQTHVVCLNEGNQPAMFMNITLVDEIPQRSVVFAEGRGVWPPTT